MKPSAFFLFLEINHFTDMASSRVRLATSEDYEAVMAIDTDVYAGGDYLPSLYADFIRDPMTRCYVLEIDNCVVSSVILDTLLYLYILVLRPSYKITNWIILILWDTQLLLKHQT